jgi:hypothetical protein
MFYSSEPFDSVGQFLDSQVIPETLEEKLQKPDKIKQIVESVMAEKRARLIETGEEMTLTLGFILDKLAGVGTKAGAVQAAVTREKLKTVMTQEKLRNETPIAALKGNARDKIKAIIAEAAASAADRSGLKGDMSAISSYFEMAPEAPTEKPITASELAKAVLEGEGGTISVVYVPEPTDARLIVSQFTHALLHLKKTHGKAKEKILIVLDEAQEYIPDRTREDDHTDISNIAVEALLRQGRKYRAHCWLGSQREPLDS